MRSSTLDILRAVAILLVFGQHSVELPLVTSLGWVGVDLFFVLSGFLVSGLLFREYQQTQHVRSGRFLLRRGFKIYPQFYLLLGFTLPIALWDGKHLPSPQVLAEAFFVQNYLQGFWAHTWSLAIEEHFYLLLAIAIALLARRAGSNPFQGLPKWILFSFAIILSLRVTTWWLHPSVQDLNEFLYLHHFPSHLRMDSLLAGVMVSYYHVFHGEAVLKLVNRFREYLAPVSILLLSPMAFLPLSNPFVYTVGFSMLWMGFSLLLLIALYPVRPAVTAGSAGRMLARLGRNSYAFYLWHIPVRIGVIRLLADPIARSIHMPIVALLLTTVVTFGATVLVAFLTTWAVETPFLRLRDRWIPSLVKSPLIGKTETEHAVDVFSSLHSSRPLQATMQIGRDRT